MYSPDDTIAAVSSPGSTGRVIVRISGADTLERVNDIFTPPVETDSPGVKLGKVIVDHQLRLDANLYVFVAPRSYTGQMMAEIHFEANPSITEMVIEKILLGGARPAGPGEFTARGFLNGKMDLAQAEAVNEVITSSNKFQLFAAEQLLSGSLSRSVSRIRSRVMDCLSLLEAGMDFSGEDIEFMSVEQGVERLNGIESELEQLLSGSIGYESVVDMPVVGLAGATNAGKSSLLNAIVGTDRSIVSAEQKTTRDVLTAVVQLGDCDCVLFDCAGLVTESGDILDELSRSAAVEALQKALVVVFCVDLAKPDLAADAEIFNQLQSEKLVGAGMKSDLLSERALAERLDAAEELFSMEFIATSAKNGAGIERFRDKIGRRVVELAGGGQIGRLKFRETSGSVALTARHKQVVCEAAENIRQAARQLAAGGDEVAAMMLRAAYQSLCDIEQQSVDEQILTNIFSRFCVGK